MSAFVKHHPSNNSSCVNSFKETTLLFSPILSILWQNLHTRIRIRSLIQHWANVQVFFAWLFIMNKTYSLLSFDASHWLSFPLFMFEHEFELYFPFRCFMIYTALRNENKYISKELKYRRTFTFILHRRPWIDSALKWCKYHFIKNSANFDESSLPFAKFLRLFREIYFSKNVRSYINNYRKWERYFNMETLENPISS